MPCRAVLAGVGFGRYQDQRSLPTRSIRLRPPPLSPLVTTVPSISAPRTARRTSVSKVVHRSAATVRCGSRRCRVSRRYPNHRVRCSIRSGFIPRPATSTPAISAPPSATRFRDHHAERTEYGSVRFSQGPSSERTVTDFSTATSTPARPHRDPHRLRILSHPVFPSGNQYRQVVGA